MGEGTTGILVRASRGEEAAFRACIDRFGPIVWGLARRLSPSRADAEDAVQEIFLDLWAHGSRYDRTKASEEAFVAVVARRRLIDRRRRARSRPATAPLEEAGDSAGAEPEAAPGDGPEIAAEAAIAVRAMARLRPEQREVLRLSIAEGLTHEEIAGRIDLPLGTVKAHARRGLLRIRRLLLGEGEEGGGDAGEEAFR